VVGVLMVDEVDWCSPHQRPGPGRGKEGVHTQSIHTDVVTGETVEVKEIGCVEGAEVEEVLPTFRY